MLNLIMGILTQNRQSKRRLLDTCCKLNVQMTFRRRPEVLLRFSECRVLCPGGGKTTCINFDLGPLHLTLSNCLPTGIRSY